MFLHGKKKVIGILVMLAFLLTLLPGMVLAGGPVEIDLMPEARSLGGSGSSERVIMDITNEQQKELEREVKISLEDAILIARSHFDINEGFDVFRSSYSEREEVKLWQLNWRDQAGMLGDMSVGVNADTGEVMSYHYFNPQEHQSTEAQGYLPKLSREEGEKIALKYFEQLTHRKAQDISAMPRYYEEPMLRKGTKYHEYSYAGLVNGHVYPINKVAITINADTGELRNFYYNWDNRSDFPNRINITQVEAAKLFNEKLEIELAYFRAFDQNENKPVQLIYQVKNAGRLMIDAATGEILGPADNYYNEFDMGMGAERAAKDAGGGISPIEQQELEKMAGLISREEALKLATAKVEVPAGYKLNNAGLSRDWEFSQLITWSFNWMYEDREKHGWITAEVDAKTGTITGFSKYEYDKNGGRGDYVEPDNYQIKGREAAIDFAWEYIKANYPELKDNLRLETPSYDFIPRPLSETPEANYYFRFTRLVNDIPFSKNYINISVDAANGKVNNMNLRWVELDFPKADQVLGLEKITEKFLAEHEIKLEYTKYYNPDKGRDGEVYLVYKIPNVKATMFDANTGAALDYNGEVVEDKTQPVYTDIEGHWAEEDIVLLSQYKLLDFEGPNFMPDKEISQGELMRIFNRLNNPWQDRPGIDPVYQDVIRLGLITQEEKDPNKSVQREELAELMIKFLGYGEVSKLDIYKLEFADAQLISPERRGAVAISAGFGFISGDPAGNFMPDRLTTRAEAATILARMLSR